MKYPSAKTLREFAKVVDRVPEILDLTGYVEPKYDGSNITVIDGTAWTRNLNPLPPHFQEGLRRALGPSLSALEELSHQYQVFLELGGIRNSPAGYREPWRGEWDYVVFDLARDGEFLPPKEAADIVTGAGLKFVHYVPMRVGAAIERWKDLLNNYYTGYEGYVLKIFLPPDIRSKAPHYSRNMLVAKFKHEYLRRSVPTTVAVGGRGPAPELDDSEILGAINKAHGTLGDKIFDKKKAMPLIFDMVRTEAEKHGVRAPKASRVYRLYVRYLDTIR